ncbi:MAG TPA: hypothetical protein VL947_00680, partial [Cytophagales bacterium]|nr:hypothetical protein [Cytophagales bacterium]
AVMASSHEITVDDITFGSANSFSDFLQHETTLKEYDAKIIRHYLDKYDNNVLLVAQKLDIGKSTIYRMIKDNEL